MKRIICFGFAISLAVSSAFADAAADLRASNAGRRAAMVPIEDDPKLPRVLLIGDSIAMGYTLPLRELLKGKANVHYPNENCHTSEKILASLDRYLGDKPWDVIQFNCGLHDLTRTNAAGKSITNGEPGVVKVRLDDYKKNLQTIVVRLKATGAELIWCTSTPLPNGLAYRRGDDVISYNAAGREVMQANGIPITDLYTAASRNGTPKWVDNGHFTVAGTREQAQEVLPNVQAALKRAEARKGRPSAAVNNLANPVYAPNASMKEWRKIAANRQRRVIYNNDGGEPARSMKSPSAQEFLDLRTTALAGTHVDSIFYCSRSSGFGLFTHFTKVGQVFTSLEGNYANNQTPAMLKAGLDPLQLIVDFTKQHKMESFWSMRMNDTHDGQRAEYGPITLRTNTLKMTHPEYLMGTEKQQPKIGSWTAVNYGLPEIRDLAFKYFEEVCQNYDVDGVELDFYRHPVYFKSTTRGEMATKEELAQMTDLLRRIRTMADEVGRKRGRPILIAVHCPDSVEYSRAMGLDIEHWMANDLLDIWVAAGTFHFNKWDYSVKLGHKYGVKVYPSLDNPRIKDEQSKTMRFTPASYRARALQVWAAGADGINMFNAPDTGTGSTNSLWQELGDPKALLKGDRDYFASYLGAVNSSNGNYPQEKFIKLQLLDSVNFKPVAPGKSVSVRLNVAEEFGKANAPKLKLRLRFKSPPKAASLQVTLNDHKLKLLQSNGEWFDFAVTPGDVHNGDNLVNATLAAAATRKTDWTDLLLEVRP